jgi:hypothetical protein
MAADEDAVLEKLRAFVMERGGSIQPVDMGNFYSREDKSCSRLLKGKVRGFLQKRPGCGLVFDPGPKNKQEQHRIRAVSGPTNQAQQPHVRMGASTSAGQDTLQPVGPPPRPRTFLPSGTEYELVSSLGRLQELIATDAALGGDKQTMVVRCPRSCS